MEKITEQFRIKGTVQEVQPFGDRLINTSYKVKTHEADAPNYLLQRINHHIFQKEYKKIIQMGREGKIPERIVHQDTKFNNVLLDEHDNLLCVIDLDTVIMPGYFHLQKLSKKSKNGVFCHSERSEESHCQYSKTLYFV